MRDMKRALRLKGPSSISALAAVVALAAMLVAAGADGYRAVKALTEIRVLTFGSN